MEQFKRSLMLLGKEKLMKLQHSHVLVVGVGGVGGYAAEFLARTGIQKLTIVDQDVVDITNLNRQIIALNSTVGRPKVEVFKERLKDINPQIEVNAIYDRISENNVESILTSAKFDYIVDAIDSKIDKADLIACAKRLNIPIISALGTGNRTGIPNFIIKDIYSTSDDGLAKAMRKLLRERGVESLDVVISSSKQEEPKEKFENERNIGSLVYFPAMCACVISAFVVEKITN